MLLLENRVALLIYKTEKEKEGKEEKRREKEKREGKKEKGIRV